MDGFVQEIAQGWIRLVFKTRRSLYACSYASSYYGPFMQLNPLPSDRRTYQMVHQEALKKFSSMLLKGRYANGQAIHGCYLARQGSN